MPTKRIAILPGDGVGTEVVQQAIKVLKAVEKTFQTPFELEEGLIGGAAFDAHGNPFPEETQKLVNSVHAVFLGAVGGPKYDTLDPAVRPEQGLLAIRKHLHLYANLRPVKAWSALMNASTLKPEILQNTDLMIVRELTGGLYFGTPKEKTAQDAVDTMRYSRHEIERIARLAFFLAESRRQHLMSVDKANVLKCSQLWREVITQLSKEYPSVTLEHQYVDNTAMQLIRKPAQFDVLLTENTFGDILSDEASMLTGSLGMLPSASIGTQTHEFGQMGLYEPSHGSAPDIVGQNKVNPIATILSLAMMLDLSFGMKDAARAVEAAMETVLNQGYRTADILEAGVSGLTQVNTEEMGNHIAAALLNTKPLQTVG